MVKMPLSVLCAILEQIKMDRPAQMEAARQWVWIPNEMINAIKGAAKLMDNQDAANWIFQELVNADRTTDDSE